LPVCSWLHATKFPLLAPLLAPLLVLARLTIITMAMVWRKLGPQRCCIGEP
jgi:hypothetical protein